jgi:hypothetical protein
MAIGAGKIEGKNDVQQLGHVLGKLKESSGSRRGGAHAQVGAGVDGARGDRGGARVEAQRRGGRMGRPARGREGGGPAEE